MCEQGCVATGQTEKQSVFISWRTAPRRLALEALAASPVFERARRPIRNCKNSAETVSAVFCPRSVLPVEPQFLEPLGRYNCQTSRRPMRRLKMHGPRLHDPPVSLRLFCTFRNGTSQGGTRLAAK